MMERMCAHHLLRIDLAALSESPNLTVHGTQVETQARGQMHMVPEDSYSELAPSTRDDRRLRQREVDGI